MSVVNPNNSLYYGKIPDSLACYFGLRGFPGKRFGLNLQKSYNEWLIVSIIDDEDRHTDFSRVTLDELLKEVVKI